MDGAALIGIVTLPLAGDQRRRRIAENALKLMTSASRGTFSRINVSSVRRLAIINGSVAFLAPEIGIAPFRRWPPTIRIRSMSPPLAFRTLADPM
jgi:hypothetical protein